MHIDICDERLSVSTSLLLSQSPKTRKTYLSSDRDGGIGEFLQCEFLEYLNCSIPFLIQS